MEKELSAERISSRITPGQSVAVLVGSRGIAQIDVVVKAVINALRAAGTQPFIVPAMGSHGGGEAGAQRRIIEGYGITEKAMGVPIRSSMETVIIGHTASGVPVHMDREAFSADAVVPVNRVKPHTDFKGPVESGLCKMLTIGCGKHKGCSALHEEGFDQFFTLIPEVAGVVIAKKNVAFGVAIVENAHEHIHTIRAIPGDAVVDEEPALLTLSKSLMPRLQFDAIDVLVVEEVGKDISGAGMDPNIIGRLSSGPIMGFDGPRIDRIVALGLSPGTHGNALGLGMADFTTRKTVSGADYEATYANAIASGDPLSGFVPVALDSEEDAIRAAIHTCRRKNKADVRVVRIKNTLALTEIAVSDNLLALCAADPRFELVR